MSLLASLAWVFSCRVSPYGGSARGAKKLLSAGETDEAFDPVEATDKGDTGDNTFLSIITSLSLLFFNHLPISLFSYRDMTFHFSQLSHLFIYYFINLYIASTSKDLCQKNTQSYLG